MKDIMELCDVVRQTAFAIHCHHYKSLFAPLALFRG